MKDNICEVNFPKVGVGVLIFNSNNHILLGKRKNSHGASSWAAPGGHLEFGENLEECIIRETLEETGLIIENLEFLAITNDIFNEENKHYVSIFMKAYLHDDQIVKNCEPNKVDEYKWFNMNDLPQNLFLPLKNLVNGFYYGNSIDNKEKDYKTIKAPVLLLKLIEALERSLLSAPVRKSPEQLNRLIADDFYEIGSSGKIYDKKYILSSLPLEQDIPFVKVINFKIYQISSDLIRANYILEEKTRRTIRTSIWKQQNNNYQMIFHQGTKYEVENEYEE